MWRESYRNKTHLHNARQLKAVNVVRLQVFGVIFVIDSSDHAQLERSKEIIGSIMANDLLMGKPMLILTNKQDLPEALDSLDICDYFEVSFFKQKPS